MKIITISREFGSGGRELGKRLADALGFAYYDREIITAVAQKISLDEDYVEKTLENGIPRSFSFSFGRTFSFPDVAQQNYTKLLIAQQQFISDIAKKGENFVIVGRGADVILEDYEPLNIFIYAQMESKIKRCRERAPEEESLTDRELSRKIKQVDSGRAVHRQLLTKDGWGEKESYHLCINTTDTSIKSLIPSVAAFANSWFDKK
ncbi:MAG: cytidylate kinase-like family protein [Clostridia bacterium]|nr:cytidylate kinase-like family protein [Clostridia bacterium]